MVSVTHLSTVSQHDWGVYDTVTSVEDVEPTLRNTRVLFIYTEVDVNDYPRISATYCVHIFIDVEAPLSALATSWVICQYLGDVHVPVVHFSSSILPTYVVATLHFTEELDSHFARMVEESNQHPDWNVSPYGPIETWPTYDASLRSSLIVDKCYIESQ
jgi:hypothetical protein